MATDGTRRVLLEHGLDVELVLKLHEDVPHVLDAIKNHKISPNYQYAFLEKKPKLMVDLFVARL